MSSVKETKLLIHNAFANVKYPGDWCLRGSSEGDEPFLLESEFAGKTDWRKLDPSFIDQAPNGLKSALAFFSDEAFHFYLPAYLIADIDGLLKGVNPAFFLYDGLTDESIHKKVNPLRYGERTWFEARRHKFSMFNQQEVRAIVAYLQFKRETDEFDKKFIDQALGNFWLERLQKPSSGVPRKPSSRRNRKK